jgi:hypothetical protein
MLKTAAICVAISLVGAANALAVEAPPESVPSMGEALAGGLTSPRETANGELKALDTYRCTQATYIRSWYNERYVSTELGYSGNQYAMLRARAEKVGPWESFQWCQSSEHPGYWSLWSLGAERWVSVELGYTGGEYAMLRARATGVGPWERFYEPYCPDGTHCSFKSTADDLYVSGEFGYTGNNYGMLRARSSTIGPWEQFFELG